MIFNIFNVIKNIKNEIIDDKNKLLFDGGGGNNNNNGTGIDRDENGHILLDHDARLFRMILNYCRGYRSIGPLGDDELRALLMEAEMWCLPQLQNELREGAGAAASIQEGLA